MANARPLLFLSANRLPWRREQRIAALPPAAIVVAGWAAIAWMLRDMAGAGDIAALGPGVQLVSGGLLRPGELPADFWASLCLSDAGAPWWQVLASTCSMAALMTVAMMLPCALPAWQSLLEKRDGAGAYRFMAGYTLVWFVFALAAAAAETGLHMAFGGPPVLAGAGVAAGGLIVLAGLYQFTPAKLSAMRHMHCTTPPRSGTNALGMGAGYARHCLKANALLMSTMLALGMMNVVAMVLLALVMLVEKVSPGRVAAGIIGVGLVGAGGAFIFAALSP